MTIPVAAPTRHRRNVITIERAFTRSRMRRRFAQPDNHWGWPKGSPNPDVVGRLHWLDAKEQALVPQSALKLYCAMERERGYVARWVTLPLYTLAERAGLPYNTADGALATLRQMGAVETRIVRRARTEMDADGALATRWESVLRYRAWGAWERSGGALVLGLPAEGWERWARGRRRPGRPKRGEGRCELARNCGVSDAPSGLDGDQQSSTYALIPAPLSSLSIFCSDVSSSTTSKQPASAQAAPAEAGAELKPVGPGGGGGPDEFALLDQLNRPANAPDPATLPVTINLPPIDPPARDITAAAELTDEMPPDVRVSMMVNAYKRAVQDVFGRPASIGELSGLRPRKGEAFSDSLVKWKRFADLELGAGVMVEHAIAPYAWARWRLEYYKQMQRKPLPIAVLFDAGTLHKQRGYFRKSYDAPVVSTTIDRENFEQLYRRQEAERRAHGQQDLFMFPRWYVELRKEEKRDGDNDPLTLYPRYKDGAWHRPGAPIRLTGRRR